MMHDVGYNLVWSTHSSLVRPGWPGGQTAYKKRLVRRFIDLLCGDLPLLAFKAHQGTNLHRIDLAVMDFCLGTQEGTMLYIYHIPGFSLSTFSAHSSFHLDLRSF